MKKIYSLALMAMMAVCAMMITSCGNDDEVSKDFTITIEFTEYQQAGISLTTQAAIIDFYQKLLGSDLKIGSGTSSYSYITIQGPASRKEATVSAVKGSSDGLTTALNNACCGDSFTFEAYNGSETYLKFSYTANIVNILKDKTWTGTYNNVNYTFKLGDKIDDTHYNATMTEGDATYPGTFQTDKFGNQFSATARTEEGYTPLSMLIQTSDASSTKFTGELESDKYDFTNVKVVFTTYK